MLKIVSGMLLAMACLDAQGLRDLLLPQDRHIVGTVVDPEGKPIPEARLDHTNDRRQLHQTDANGRFDLDTQAPVIVIRKAGFQSELVLTQDATEIRVTLRKLTPTRPFPACSGTGPYEGINGSGASFQFSKLPGVTASKQGQDVDYGARSYYVDTDQGPKGIMHGSGPMWSFGVPVDQDVWRSIKYEEITYDFGPFTVMDARGQFQNGDRWRYLGKFGESASYSGVDEGIAKTLDRFLDSACLKLPSRQ
jgi:hypothetical protein